MGSQAAQAQLWGRQPKDWSAIQEPTGKAGYDYALAALNLTGQETLLDIGCGTGVFLSLAAPKVRWIIGFDATVEFAEEARRRLPAYPFLVGDMEDLPLPDEAYDIVTGFNSFQYAATISNALAEAHRVLKPGGRLVAMIWGNKEDCQAAISLGAIGSLLPPPPPGTPGPFALSEQQALERPSENPASPSSNPPTSIPSGTIPTSPPSSAACSPPAPLPKPSPRSDTTRSPRR